MLIVNASRAISHAVATTEGSTDVARAMTPPAVGLSLSSSSSSSSNDHRGFYELIHGANESHRLYSDATREVGWLQLCLDAVEVALSTSERETTVVWVATVDT